jgi:hypothetical protein
MVSQDACLGVQVAMDLGCAVILAQVTSAWWQ